MPTQDSATDFSDLLGSTAPESRDMGSAVATQRMVALTILGHPDVSRVGDRALLPRQRAEREVSVNRLTPKFSPPAGGPPRPLADKYLSRQPIQLVWRDNTFSGLVIKRGDVSSSCEIDGVELGDEYELPEGDLSTGVTLVLAGRVALLMHIAELRPSRGAPHFDLVGESSAMTLLRQEIEQVAPHSVPVLIRGATGTGKELVARALHRGSPRAVRPLVAVNMGALPPALAAAELFGAVRGAYTGAEKRVGFFRRADGGTLFLDEIGETPPEVQVMLLRALETSEIQPVGASQPIRVDVRVVAATDAALEDAIEKGRFRGPLLHRLQGFTLQVPRLIERRDDIGRLLFHFLGEELAKLGKAHRLDRKTSKARPWLPATEVARLVRHSWPGNVRELRNVARQLVIRALESPPAEIPLWLDRILESPALPHRAPPPGDRDDPSAAEKVIAARRPPKSYRPPHEVDEHELIAALKANRWNLKPTARQLGVSRASLYVLIDRSSKVRRASDIEPTTLRSASQRHSGDLDAMAEELEVSRYALQHRLREIEPGR